MRGAAGLGYGRRMRTRPPLLLGLSALATFAALSSLAIPARADDARTDAGIADREAVAALPVITGGREAEMLALAKPFALGSDVSPGWHLENVTASETAIRYLVLGPGGAKTAVRLEHPKRAPSQETTPSFAVHREVSKEGGAAPADPKILDALVDAIRKNDGGNFWPAKGPADRRGDGKIGDGKGEARGADQGDSHRPDQGDGGGGFRFPMRRVLLVGGLLLVLAALMVSRRKSPKG